ncbi:MAG: glycosyltransferase [Candidatus Limnocylindrales bacterium]
MTDQARPRVCVVMPAYRSAATLPRAAASVLSQTFPDLVLGIGVRPTDHDTLTAARAIEDTRTKIIPADGASISNARNCVIRAIPADLYMFLDSDDAYGSPDVVETYVRDLDIAPDPSLRYGDWIAVSPVDASQRLRAMPAPRSRQYDLLLLDNFVATGAVMVPAVILEEVGLFDEQYLHAEDWDLWLRIARQFPLRHVPIAAYLYTRQKLVRLYPRRHFASERKIASRQPAGALLRGLAALTAHGRYAAYWVATLRLRRGMALLDLGPLDIIGLPVVAALRLVRYGRINL